MRDSGLTSLSAAGLLKLAGGLASPTTRAAACSNIAAAFGCDTLWLFSRDPELDILLPALGTPQTLPDPVAWRAFLERCVSDHEARGELPDASGQPSPVYGFAHGSDAVLVFSGRAASSLELDRFDGFAALLGALLYAERRIDAADVRSSLARQSAARASALAGSLQQMRERLESALVVAEQSRGEAENNARRAEELAEELGVQAAHLEDQATELETLNAELAQRTEEAEQARAASDAANRAKSDFLATMSHELRTPINAIIGYSELIEMGVSGAISPEQRLHLERIQASSRHLLTLINDVLDLAKIEAGHLEVRALRGDLRTPVTEAFSLVSLQAADRGIALEKIDPPSPVVYYGAEDRVRQILVNLLSNAVKFTESGGRVTVRYQACDAQPAPIRGRDGPWAMVEVEDTGIGMSEADLGRVFQPFIQAKMGHDREHGGTGLGLTISRQLALLMGGDLTVRSKPGIGSCFTLYVPARPVQSQPIDDALRVGAAGSGGSAGPTREAAGDS